MPDLVAVTGAAGFIGGRLTERLALEEGVRVNALARDPARLAGRHGDRVRVCRGDVTDPDSLAPLVEGADTVFHCAASGDPALARRVNVEGTLNVARACLEAGVRRIVHFSTVAVHGPTLHEGLDETAPFRKLGLPYSDTKIDGEEAFTQFVASHDVEGTIVRPTYVWGPASRHFTVEPLRAIAAGRFGLVDGGGGACNAVHVDNVIDVALRAAHDPRAVGEAFLIRDGERNTWKAFFAGYAALVGVDVERLATVPSSPGALRALGRGLRKPLIAAQKRLSGPPRSVAVLGDDLLRVVFADPFGPWQLARYASPGFISIAKVERLLGYRPRVTLASGMEACARWLREHPDVLG